VRRSYVLVTLIGVAFAIAVGLRVRSQFMRPKTELLPQAWPGEQVLSVPVPRDYVAEPVVAPDETTHGPHRIISLAPSMTEIVCALGMRDRLIGRTQYCQHPPDVQSVPQVGALMDTHYTKIKSLLPDLVLTTTDSGPVTDNLRKLGLPCETVPHDSLDEVYIAIEKVGRLCGRPQTAQMLIDAIRADMDSLHVFACSRGMPQRRVLVALGELPVPPRAIFVAGPDSFLDAMVRFAGHQNAASDVLKVSYGEIPLEKLRAVDPEVILQFSLDPQSPVNWAELYQSWSQVGSLRAIDHQQVRVVGGVEWLSAGPRIAICLHRFITVLSEFR